MRRASMLRCYATITSGPLLFLRLQKEKKKTKQNLIEKKEEERETNCNYFLGKCFRLFTRKPELRSCGLKLS